MTDTIFASRKLWPSVSRLHRYTRTHGVALTERGEVLVDGVLLPDVTYELAGRVPRVLPAALGFAPRVNRPLPPPLPDGWNDARPGRFRPGSGIQAPL